MRLLLLCFLALAAFGATACGLFAVSSDPGAFPCAADHDCAVANGYRCDSASKTCRPGETLDADGGAPLDAGPDDAGQVDGGAADAGAPSDGGARDGGDDEEEGAEDEDGGPAEDYVGEDDAGVVDAGEGGDGLPEGVVDPSSPDLTLLASDSLWTHEEGEEGALDDDERLYGQAPTTGFTALVDEWTNENTNSMPHYKASVGGLVHPLLHPVADEHDGHIWVRGDGVLARYVGRALAPFDTERSSYALAGLLRTSVAVPEESTAVARMGLGPLSRNDTAPTRGVYVGFRDSEVVLTAPGADGTMTSWRLAEVEAGVTYLFTVRLDLDIDDDEDVLTAALWEQSAEDITDLVAWRRVRASVDVAEDLTHASLWRDDRLSSSGDDHWRFDELRFWSLD